MIRTIIPLCFLCLASCIDSQLSRTQVEVLLNDCYITDCKNQGKCKISIPKTWNSGYGKTGTFCTAMLSIPPSQEEVKMINSFINAGLVRLEQEKIYRDCAYWTKNTLYVTDAGMPFLLDDKYSSFEFLAAKISVGEITGIIQKEGENTARAEYTLKVSETTPFGQVTNINCRGINQIQTAYFTKYDDGWRLNR